MAKSDQRISLIPLDGGGPRAVTTSALPAGMSMSTGNGIVLGMPAFSATVRGLSLVSPGDAKPKVLTKPSPNAMDHDPLVLDDGVTVLYIEISMATKSAAGLVSRDQPRLGVGNLATNTWTVTDFQLDGVVGFSHGILVYRDGVTTKAVRFDVRARRAVGAPVVIDGLPPGVDNEVMAGNGTMVFHVLAARYQLELVDDGGTGQVVSRDTVSLLSARFSPDGKQVAVVESDGADAAVRVLDLATHGMTKLAIHGRGGLDWMPDGRQVVVAGRGIVAIRSDGVDGAAPRALCASANQACGDVAGVTISPDGHAVVFGTMYADGFNIMVHGLEGDSLTKPLVSTPAVELAPRFSPDGRWLAYTSDESGRQEVYVQPFPGPGRRVQISTDGGEQPVWSSDGRLFYRAGKAMMVAQLSRTTDAATVTSRRKLFEGDFYGIGDYEPTYDVSPDGRHFLMARRIGTGGGQLIAWVDWLGALESRLDKVQK
jgi:hypothetical protein